MNNLVVGDYIVCLENSGAGFIKDNLYIFKEYIREYLYVEINKNSTKGWYRTKFRKATPAEIEQHLRNEAAKNGFVIGAEVRWRDHSPWTIKTIEFFETEKEFTNKASYAHISKKYILAARDGCHSAEICEELKLVENNISINGYKAEYFDHYIQFGCAKISITMLRQLKDMYNYDGWGNRELEGKIMIGKGEFDKEIIEKLLDNHKKKFGQ